MTILCHPLVNAPNGYVWRWRGEHRERGIAHLPPVDNRTAVCGRRTRGTWAAFQIGGYSQAPCHECLLWLQGREVNYA